MEKKTASWEYIYFNTFLFSSLDVVMKYLNAADESMADLQDVNGLGSRYFSSKEELHYKEHTVNN